MQKSIPVLATGIIVIGIIFLIYNYYAIYLPNANQAKLAGARPTNPSIIGSPFGANYRTEYAILGLIFAVSGSSIFVLYVVIHFVARSRVKRTTF